MSRAAASKTRGADETEPPASQTPVIAHEIVPGKFNDNDWTNMVDKDGSDEFIMDIMDELMETTMSAIYDKYIQKQLLPFTITQARDAITEIIEWQFLARDEGEQNINTDLGWAQDEEPEPAVTDCWAQGSVPRSIITAPTPPLEDIPEAVEEMAEEAVAEPQKDDEISQEPAELADVVSDTDETTEVVNAESAKLKQKSVVSKPSTKEDYSKRASKAKFKPYRGKLKSAGVSKMTESLEETEIKMVYDDIAASMTVCEDKPSTLMNMPASCTSILKVQTGRPPGNKDVVYDEYGNVVAVMKLDAEKLPTHKVNVKYHVVDPAVEAAQARLDAMRKGKTTGSKQTKRRSKSIASETLVVKSKPSSHASMIAPLPPPLSTPRRIESVGSRRSSTSDERGVVKTPIEEMEVSHGVIIREGGRVKKGPGRYYGKLDILDECQKGMKPVNLRILDSDITVADLLDRTTPILRPIGEASPLPPIVPSPPANPPAQSVS